VREQIRQGMGKMTPEAYDAYVKSGAGTRHMVTSDSDFQTLVGCRLASDRTAVGDALVEMYVVDLRPSLSKINAPALVLAAWQSYAQYTNHERHWTTLRDQFANLKDVQIDD
jgi:hypothetical protein